MLSEATQQQIQFGNSTIEYELSYADRRTLAISVHPDLRVTVEAPDGSDLDLIEQKVRKRASWILKQQRDFERYLPGLPPRQYVSGETHRYLGRQYRLKVLQSQTDYEVVKMNRGRIVVYASDTRDREGIRQLLEKWYRKRAKRVFRERLDICFSKVSHLGIDYPEMAIRTMKSRWGSCTTSGRILLNLKLIQVPKRYIDYVIMHELCHLKEHNHGKAFYALLDQVMPDWRERKQRLNEYEFS